MKTAIGTATPIGVNDNDLQMAMEWYDGAKTQPISGAWFANRTLGCFPGTPRTEYRGGNSNVVWAAVYNRFFTMIAIPPTNAPAPQVVARRIHLNAPDPDEVATNPKAITNQFGFQAAFLYPETSLAPHQTVERRLDVFAGPKEYNTLAKIGFEMKNELRLTVKRYSTARSGLL